MHYADEHNLISHTLKGGRTVEWELMEFRFPPNVNRQNVDLGCSTSERALQESSTTSHTISAYLSTCINNSAFLLLQDIPKHSAPPHHFTCKISA
jgi:hypothetical protein